MTLLKSIVVCLVLANVGYFLWAHGIAATPDLKSQAQPAATLRLASEAPDSGRGPATDAVAAGSSVISGGHGADAPHPETGARVREIRMHGLNGGPDSTRCLSAA